MGQCTFPVCTTSCSSSRLDYFHCKSLVATIWLRRSRSTYAMGESSKSYPRAGDGYEISIRETPLREAETARRSRANSEIKLATGMHIIFLMAETRIQMSSCPPMSSCHRPQSQKLFRFNLDGRSVPEGAVNNFRILTAPPPTDPANAPIFPSKQLPSEI